VHAWHKPLTPTATPGAAIGRNISMSTGVGREGRGGRWLKIGLSTCGRVCRSAPSTALGFLAFEFGND